VVGGKGESGLIRNYGNLIAKGISEVASPVNFVQVSSIAYQVYYLTKDWKSC